MQYIINGMVKVYPFKGDMNKMADENKGLKADIKGVNMEDPYPNGFESAGPATIKVIKLFDGNLNAAKIHLLKTN